MIKYTHFYYKYLKLYKLDRNKIFKLNVRFTHWQIYLEKHIQFK
jgi:hypothetical protein